MARPMKEGYEYFPFDVVFLGDKKVRLLNAEFGDKCIKTLIALLCRVYREKGYYATVDDDDCLLLSQGELSGQTPQYIKEVIQGCVRRSLFDERVYNTFGVLTSVGIQRRYLNMAKERATIPIYQEYLLLDLQHEEKVTPDTLNKVVLKTVNPGKTRGFPGENPSFPAENAPKEKKSKEKKSKEKEPSLTEGDTLSQKESVDSLFEKFWNAYPRKNDKKDARKAFGAIKDIAVKLPMILKDISVRKNTTAWTDQGGRFIPYPATYLRGERWEDDIIDVPSKAAAGNPLKSGYEPNCDEYEKRIKEISAAHMKRYMKGKEGKT